MQHRRILHLHSISSPLLLSWNVSRTISPCQTKTSGHLRNALLLKVADQYMSCIDRRRGLQRFSGGASFRCIVFLTLAASFAFGVLFAVACDGFAGVFGGFGF